MKYFSKRLCISVIVATVVSILCSFLFVKNGIDLPVERYNDTSIYIHSACNFIIPSPGLEQVDELEKNDFIDHVEPYFYTETTAKIKDKEVDSNVIMIDDVKSLEHSPYTKQRLIDGTLGNSHSAIVDFSFSKVNHVKVGDTIEIMFGLQKYSYKVSAICETNTMYNGGVVLVNWTAEEKQSVIEFASAKLNYSGAWIVSGNHLQCENYLMNDYKPLGRLKDRSEFSSDEAYQIHLEAFNNADFSAEIIDFSTSYTQVESKYEDYQIKALVYFSFAVLLPLIVALLIMLLGYAKNQKQLVKKAISVNADNRSKILRLKNLEIGLIGLITMIVYTIFIVLYKNFSVVWINIALLKTDFIVGGLAMLIGFLLLIILNVYKFNKVFRSIKTNKE